MTWRRAMILAAYAALIALALLAAIAAFPYNQVLHVYQIL